MKNLKKVLALVLAFACAFTMFAGAAFTDAADINADNADAVELLTALNIIEGYEDGSFQPEGTVTRAEMAKMIFTIRNGGNDDASAYETVTTSFTDINGHWAAGYIKYLQNTGIVAGKSAYIFDPDSTVTTAEAMKMALVLSGYRADKANLTGTAWQNNTIALATTVGMTKDVHSAVAEGCTRQDAAQILSNTLTEVYAVQWSEVTNSFLNDSKAGLAWGGNPIKVGSKWMNLRIDTGYLVYGPSSKTNPKGIEFVGDEYGKQTFRDTKIDVSDLFGYEVKVVWDYEHEDDVDGVYGVYKTSDNSDSSAMWKGVKYVSPNKVKLNDETFTVDSNSINVYVNGDDVISMNISCLTEGAYADVVTFIDDDGDGKIDNAQVKNQNVVKITYVGNDVLNTSELIGNLPKDGSTAIATSEFTSYTVDPDLSDVNTYEGIAKNDYAKVTYDYYNDKVTYEKIDAVEAKIEATRTSSGTKEIRIDGTWYKAVDGYTLPSLVSGDTIEYVAIDNLIYNAKKVDGTWGSKSLAVVYNVTNYGAGVNTDDLQISLITRDGTKKTAILDKYNNKDVTYSSNNVTYAKGLDGSMATETIATARNTLVGQLVTYREDGNSVSLMPVNADNVGSVKFRQLAGYDNIYKNLTFNSTKDVINAQAWDNAYAAAKDYNIADDAVVFAYIGTNFDKDGDAKVISGKDLKNLETADGYTFTTLSTVAVGGTVNGVDYVQAVAVKLNKLPTVKGANYAYVLNAAETIDNDDYRYFELWTEDGLLAAYEESSDEYTYNGGEIVTYDLVSTGERTIIKNVSRVDQTSADGKNSTLVGYVTSDGFYGNSIAINGGAYDLANDCVVVNVNTDTKAGIEGDAKAAAREAKKSGGSYVKNIVYVVGNDGDLVFVLIDGKNNEIKDTSPSMY